MPDQDAMDFEVILEVRNAGDQAFIKSLLDAEGIIYLMQAWPGNCSRTFNSPLLTAG